MFHAEGVPEGSRVRQEVVEGAVKGCMAEALRAGTVQIAKLAGACVLWALRVLKAKDPGATSPPYNDAAAVSVTVGLTCALNRRTCPSPRPSLAMPSIATPGCSPWPSLRCCASAPRGGRSLCGGSHAPPVAPGAPTAPHPRARHLPFRRRGTPLLSPRPPQWE